MKMKILSALVLSASFLMSFTPLIPASVTFVTTVPQPLDGFDGDSPVILRVPYVQWHAPLDFGFLAVTKPFVPPTDAPQPIGDINLASVIGLKTRFEELEVSESKTHIRITLDCAGIDETKLGGRDLLEIFSATLECFRQLCPTKGEFIVDFALIARPQGQEALIAKFAEFQKHPKDQVFWKGE